MSRIGRPAQQITENEEYMLNFIIQGYRHAYTIHNRMKHDEHRVLYKNVVFNLRKLVEKKILERKINRSGLRITVDYRISNNGSKILLEHASKLNERALNLQSLVNHNV